MRGKRLDGEATSAVQSVAAAGRAILRVDTKEHAPYTGGSMHFSLDLSPDLHAKLARLAAEERRGAEALAREAIERMVDCDAWFLRQVEQGFAAADRGEFIEHDDMLEHIDRRYPG